MDVRYGIAAALLASLACTGCGDAAAQERVAWEHGVLEWVRYESATEGRERFSWATAREEVHRDTAAAFFGAIGLEADQRGNAADRVSALDHLSRAGWLLVNRTDIAYTDAGGSAIAERYVLRRRR
jgi:hypothetical protein